MQGQSVCTRIHLQMLSPSHSLRSIQSCIVLDTELDVVTNSTYNVIADSLKEVISECCGTASQTRRINRCFVFVCIFELDSMVIMILYAVFGKLHERGRQHLDGHAYNQIAPLCLMLPSHQNV